MQPIRPFRRQATIRQDIRQLRANSFDFDFYRTQAIALRGRAMREALTLKSALAGLVAIVGVVAIGFLAAAASVHTRDHRAALTTTNAVPIR
jgi:hypothetical protein